MLHFIRFAVGVVTGIAATQLLKNKTAKASLEKAEDWLRDATISSLQAIEKASAKARAQLASDPPTTTDFVENKSGRNNKEH
jgi:hypothetical protein